MNELTILLTLASVHFIALMSPGPDVALVVQNASRYGRQTGLFIALGLSVGILLHSLLSLTGVSYLVHQQPMLYALLQLLGGSYLLYLGIGALHSVLASAIGESHHHSTAVDAEHETPSLSQRLCHQHSQSQGVSVFCQPAIELNSDKHVALRKSHSRDDFIYVVISLVCQLSVGALW